MKGWDGVFISLFVIAWIVTVIYIGRNVVRVIRDVKSYKNKKDDPYLYDPETGEKVELTEDEIEDLNEGEESDWKG